MQEIATALFIIGILIAPIGLLMWHYRDKWDESEKREIERRRAEGCGQKYQLICCPFSITSFRAKHKHSLSFVSAAVLALDLLTSCGSGEVRDGWSGTNLPNHMTYSYAAFTGVQRGIPIQAEAGHTIVLEYQTTVNMGELIIRVEDLKGEALWEVVLPPRTERHATANVEVTRGGQYVVAVQGQNARGSFQVSWQND